ncbi:hypothetical protein LEP1GSC103_2879 [Leptospira borgpetersenii serovar Javanica str. UI 09931]|uniref:Uncharacterized protein n=1 Tax=Leptospira borgpetersenii serovar Javanica str. UI 09931 TaxID=1049767 RepID=A0AAV3JAL7_LEPBO|nr:hypothetical protein C4Q31_01790 [Leptospira borgpetersenii serovar Ceylonica]EMN59316.1 hypothetical protein LEP1GSC090_1374 [Leptospira borgpetersenii serovar Javanica str. MK146]EPG57438.1 hypothetical protein LEP1GSC103_2879 [Leptospira borgpetersenii serovar Javanica str. UI 09931]
MLWAVDLDKNLGYKTYQILLQIIFLLETSFTGSRRKSMLLCKEEKLVNWEYWDVFETRSKDEKRSPESENFICRIRKK